MDGNLRRPADRDVARRWHGCAWAALAAALGLHVADEAVHDFLSLYNPTVLRIRSAIPFLPLPVFTFEVWLAGLSVAVAAMLAVTPLVVRGARWLRGLSYVLAAILVLNGLGHAASSIYLGRPAPGLYSSPALVAAAVGLLVATRRAG